jgi:hypothetical protein
MPLSRYANGNIRPELRATGNSKSSRLVRITRPRKISFDRGSENEVGDGSAPECGDELLAEFDCDERFPPPLPQPVAGREEDGVRGAAGSENEDGGGSALECGDEQLADVDCDENEQSDEFDVCLLGRTLPDSERVLKSSLRFSLAA